MDIEVIKTTVFLKSREGVFPKGKIYRHPNIPTTLIEEARAGAGTVEILKRFSPAPSPPQPKEVKGKESEEAGGPAEVTETKAPPEETKPEEKPQASKKGKKLLLKKGK